MSSPPKPCVSPLTTAYRTVAPLLAAAGVYRLLQLLQRRKALVLMYHGVITGTASEPLGVNQNHVDLKQFAWQLDFLKRHYQLVPLEDLLMRLRRRAPVAGLAAITFDDGYLNVYSNAAPLLLHRGIPATIFLIAGLVGSNRLTWYDTVETLLLQAGRHQITCHGRSYDLVGDRRHAIRALKIFLKTLPPDARDSAIAGLATQVSERNRPLAMDHLRLMDWSHVLELHRRGIAFGVHSYSHPNLSTVPPPNLAREIEHAAQLISTTLSLPLHRLCFSYPDGDYNQAVRDRVEAAGLLGAVAVGRRLATAAADPFAVPRIGVSRYHSKALFCDATVALTQQLKRLLSLSEGTRP